MEIVLLLFLLVLLGVFSYGYLVYWIYTDAHKYGEDPLGWMFLASFLYVGVLPFYFSTRKNNKVSCINCEKWFPRTLKDCPYCGKKNAQSTH